MQQQQQQQRQQQQRHRHDQTMNATALRAPPLPTDDANEASIEAILRARARDAFTCRLRAYLKHQRGSEVAEHSRQLLHAQAAVPAAPDQAEVSVGLEKLVKRHVSISKPSEVGPLVMAVVPWFVLLLLFCGIATAVFVARQLHRRWHYTGNTGQK